MFPEPHVIPATAEHKYTVILLHGRGSDGEEFATELSEGRSSTDQSKSIFEQLSASIKWIFPSARERYSTVFQEDMQEWFDIYSLTDPDAEAERQVDGLKESIDYVQSIIAREMETIPAHRIILGGISQGFATASQVLLALPTALGGFVGISGWVSTKALSVPHPLQSVDTPVLVTHSLDDGTVEVGHGRAAFARLQQLGYGGRVEIYTDGGHWLQEPRGYDDLCAFLARCLESDG